MKYDAVTTEMTFTPNESLEYYEVYDVGISEIVTGEYNNNIAPISWSFMTAADTNQASYEVTFVATWSFQTHPTYFPPDPHFSGLIGMTHSSDSRLFNVGGIAWLGIKSMAETGSKNTLTSEIQELINFGTTHNLLSGGGITTSPNEVYMEFDIELYHPLTSIVTMIAPSQHWFATVGGLNLYNRGKWIADTTVFLKSYDYGTDSGLSFTSANEVTEPFEPVYEITTAPLAVDGKVVPLGTMHFKRLYTKKINY